MSLCMYFAFFFSFLLIWFFCLNHHHFRYSHQNFSSCLHQYHFSSRSFDEDVCVCSSEPSIWVIMVCLSVFAKTKQHRFPLQAIYSTTWKQYYTLKCNHRKFSPKTHITHKCYYICRCCQRERERLRERELVKSNTWAESTIPLCVSANSSM